MRKPGSSSTADRALKRIIVDHRGAGGVWWPTASQPSTASQPTNAAQPAPALRPHLLLSHLAGRQRAAHRRRIPVRRAVEEGFRPL